MYLKGIGILACLVIIANLLSCDGKDEQYYPPPIAPEPPEVEVYLTKANKAAALTKQVDFVRSYNQDSGIDINLDRNVSFQEVDGFGFALTGGSAEHITAMSASTQADLLSELFGTGSDAIHISYLRISIGASDLNSEPFTYNDLPIGETDVDQTNFSLDKDRDILIPLLKKIIAINPDIKIMASPWSAPSWMKTNNATKGGELRQEYYSSYATYFKKYIEAMASEGIEIDAITIQNEPLHEGNNPSMGMSWFQQATFIKDHLGPLFEANAIQTKIILYDHNADNTDYPISILDNSDARRYVDGSAFHLYGGKISDLSLVHNAHQDKNIYFTEQWFGAPGVFPEDLRWHTREIIIGATRNWSKAVIEWNLSSNPSLTPHTNGGCTACLGGITIDGNNVTRNAGYYVVGHASKFVLSGSKRIASNYPNETPNVCFLTTDNRIVLLVLNNTEESREINVNDSTTFFSATLDAGSVATFIWKNE